MENNGRSPSLLIFSKSPTVPQLGPLAEGTEWYSEGEAGRLFLSPSPRWPMQVSIFVLVTLSAAISNI